MANKKKKSKVPAKSDQDVIIEQLLENISNNQSLKNNNSFTIPESFLHQLSEFTNGGFVLFTFDSSGSPKVHQCFDDDKNNLAMSNFIKLYGNSMEQIHGNILMSNISQDNDEDDGEDLIDS